MYSGGQWHKGNLLTETYNNIKKKKTTTKKPCMCSFLNPMWHSLIKMCHSKQGCNKYVLYCLYPLQRSKVFSRSVLWISLAWWLLLNRECILMPLAAFFNKSYSRSWLAKADQNPQKMIEIPPNRSKHYQLHLKAAALYPHTAVGGWVVQYWIQLWAESYQCFSCAASPI